MSQNPMKIALALVLAVTTNFFATAARAQPASRPATQPDEKITVPEADLTRVPEAAVFAETANAAGLDWKPYYSAFMKLERRKDWTDEQIKFIGMYFGAIQGHFEDELRQKKYTEDEIRTLEKKLEQETARLNKEATTRPYRKRGE